ncbi:uncharacterized protein LOC129581589 isoform X2 [Paramacrobiotus metropolitanus]|nr:uncharacterized protein LOC129581589 isoform X2 [Paramacrobiotus metropolitanus]
MENETRNGSTWTLLTPGGTPMDGCNRSLQLFFTNNYGGWEWITKITFPILLAIGTVGNIVGILIAYRCKRGSQRTFLLCLYCINLLYLWNNLIVLIGSKTWEPDPSDDTSVYNSFFIPTGGVWFYLSEVLYLASQWILMMFCFDRCVAIVFPLYHFANWQRGFGALAITLAFAAAALNALLLPVTYYWNQQNFDFTVNSYVRNMPDYLSRWKEVDVWWEALFGIIVYILIFMCNTVLLYALKQRERRWSTDSTSGLDISDAGNSSIQNSKALSLSPTSSVHTTYGANKSWMVTRCPRSCAEISKTRMLFVSSLFYLITQSLTMIMPFLEIASHPPFCTFNLTMSFLIPWDAISSFLVNIYFSIGFIFLIVVGPIERKKLCLLCP